MAIDSVTTISLSVNITLAVFSTALLFLVVWQDARRRSNQYFALCMALFALYGAFNTAWQVPQQFKIDPKPLFYLTTTVYVAAIILLFNFIIAFAGLPCRHQHIEHLISFPLGALFVALTWMNRTYSDFQPRAAGNYTYTISLTGQLGAAILLIYLLSSVGLLYRQHSPRAREMAVPIIILMTGISGFAAVPALHRISFNALAVTLMVVMMGRLVLKYQVFQPLADLNAELARKNSQLVEATRMKLQFLANMSHELRTPLNSIIGYAELVLNRTYGELTEKQVDRLEKVQHNGRMLLELINDVLDLSKIEAGRLDLALGRVPTAAMLDSLVQSYESKAAEKGLMLVRGYGQLPDIWADENRARQIFSNLLSNAIKFTAQGVVIVRGHFDAARRQVILSVTDTGIGIPPEQRASIFEAFQQGDDSLTRPFEGTGLGLAIARRLTELHGGRIWLESVTGRGTTFHVALPAAEDAPQPGRTLQPGAQASGPLILAIDDDREAIEVFQGHLEAANFRVYGACSPDDGLRMARDLRPALITLDVRMPGIDGWRVLEVLRRDPATAHIPVLVITATDDRDLAQMLGVDGFLNKPVRPADLLEHIQRLIAAAQARQDGQR